MQKLGAAEIKTFFDWIEENSGVLWKRIPPLVTTGGF
jgi:hypothetical protein